MDGSELSEFLVASREGYIAERIASGEDAAEAARAVKAMSQGLFPDDKPGPGHLVYALVEDGTR